MKVLTFSRVFPAYHPKKGQPTYFVERLLKSLPNDGYDFELAESNVRKMTDLGIQSWYDLHPKHHTIRAGNRWKVGDKFSPRVWSDKPYKSKQIIIAPDIEIKKVWDIEIETGKEYWFFKLNGEDISNGREDFNIDEFVETLAKNDGLSLQDFLNWFPKSFKGQIICWNENIIY